MCSTVLLFKTKKLEKKSSPPILLIRFFDSSGSGQTKEEPWLSLDATFNSWAWNYHFEAPKWWLFWLPNWVSSISCRLFELSVSMDDLSSRCLDYSASRTNTQSLRQRGAAIRTNFFRRIVTAPTQFSKLHPNKLCPNFCFFRKSKCNFFVADKN